VPDAPLSDIRVATPRDTAPDLARVVALHAAVVAVPLLLVFLILFSLVLGSVLAGVLIGVVLALAAGAAATALRLRDVDEGVRVALGARPVTASEHPRLHGLAENVAMAVGVGMPRLFVIETPARNAVTWGDGRGPACAAFTTGLLDAVDRIQLEALLGRQLVVTRDGSVDVLTVAAALFDRLPGFLDAPVASIVHHAIDDRAVVGADLEGVRATCYPPGMVAAFEVVRSGDTAVPGVPRALSGACLAAPDAAEGAFAVHPPLADRIDLLREI
jgi:Zn-dependent protease with chaperone function